MALNDHAVRSIGRTDINDVKLVDGDIVHSDVRLSFVVDGNGVKSDTVDGVALDQDDEVDFAEGDLHRVDDAEILGVQNLLVLVEETLFHEKVGPFVNLFDKWLVKKLVSALFVVFARDEVEFGEDFDETSEEFGFVEDFEGLYLNLDLVVALEFLNAHGVEDVDC